MPGSTQYTRCQGGDSLVVRTRQIHITEKQGIRCATIEIETKCFGYFKEEDFNSSFRVRWGYKIEKVEGEDDL